MNISKSVAFCIFSFALGMVLSASAAEVTAEMAAKAVGNWRVRKGQLGTALGRTVAASRRVEHGGAKFNVVQMAGGGYVVTPADTSVRPVILFSDDEDFTVSEENPALALLVGELAEVPKPAKLKLQTASAAPQGQNEQAWAELLSDKLVLGVSSASSVDDVRVEPFVKAKWGQKTVKVGGSSKNCFNYYTPENYPCGCVATATAQIMRRFEWPRADVEIAPFKGEYCKIDDEAVTLTAQGGRYDWSKMPYDASVSTSDERKMIGKLTSDIGIALGMDYSDGSSSASTLTARYVLMTFYGYTQAVASVKDSSDASGDYGRVLRANFNAKLPVQLSIRKNSGGGHSIVGDGYGYIGKTVYYHLNFGWTGSSTAWYAPPDIGDYDYFSGMVHNIYTNQSPSLVIASGRITDAAGKPVAGMPVWAEGKDGARACDAVVSDEHGIYALYVEPGDYRVVAHRDVTSAKGEVVAFVGGETTASPAECVSVQTYAKGTNTTTPNAATGNASECDITVVRTDYAPEGTVAFAGPVTVGTDFAAVSAEVTAQVVHFGKDYETATLAVALYEGETQRGEKTFALNDLDAHTKTASFVGLAAGTVYRLIASLKIGGAAVASDVQEFTAARAVETAAETPALPSWRERDPDEPVAFAPSAAAMGVGEFVMDVELAGLYDFETLKATPVDVAAAVAGIRTADDVTGEFVIWDGAQWQRSGVAMEEGGTYRIALAHEDAHMAYFVLLQDGRRVALGEGTWRTSPAVREAGAIGAADLLSFSGRGYDPNLVARADGAVEYANLAAALAAQETKTIVPLWSTTGTIPSDVRLLVFSVRDPDGLLVLSGGTPIKETTGPDGTVTRAYGTMDPAKVAESDYLKATMLLGLDEPLTEASDVQLGAVAAEDGALGFRVTVDGEAVMRERVTDFVRMAETLSPAVWRQPTADEVEFDGGRVTVLPSSGAGGTFVRLEIPSD